MARNKSKKRKAKRDAPQGEALAGQSKVDSRKQDLIPENEVLVPAPVYDQLLGWLCLVGLVALAFLLTFHTLIDTDIFWHLKTGEIIFKTHKVPTRDIYSFTMAGKEWIDSQWLFQLVIYALYRISGYGGIIVFSSILASLTFLLIAAPAFKPGKYFLVVMISLAALLSASFRLKLRPELLTFFYIALEIFLIGQFRRGKKWAWYPLPILLLLWVNSEGLWPIYLAILLAFLFEEVIFAWDLRMFRGLRRSSPLPPKQSAKRLLAALLCSIPLAFCNPHGYRGVVFPWILFREISSKGSHIHQIIQELQSPFVSLTALDRNLYIVIIVLSALVFGFFLYRRVLTPAALALWAGFLYLSLGALRNVALFAVITAAVTCLVLAENKDRELLPFSLLKRGLLKLRPVGACIMLGLVVYFSVDAAMNRLFFQSDSHAKFGVGALETEYPIRGAGFLKSILTSQGKLTPLNIVSDMESSGYLIWTGYPEWKIYYDPRLEVYGDKFLVTYLSVLSDYSKFKQADAQYGFDAAAISFMQDWTSLILQLTRDPDWSLVYMDGYGVIFLKNKPELAPIIANHPVDISQGFASPVPSDLEGKYLARERYCRGYFLLKSGHPDLALPELEAAVKNWPDKPDMNFSLGKTLNLLQRYGEARPFLEKANRLQPGFSPNQIQLARAYARTGEPEQAIQLFKQVLKEHPLEIIACMELAQIYESTSDGSDAHRQWQNCQKIYQSDPKFFKVYEEKISRGLNKQGE